MNQHGLTRSEIAVIAASGALWIAAIATGGAFAVRSSFADGPAGRVSTVDSDAPQPPTTTTAPPTHTTTTTSTSPSASVAPGPCDAIDDAYALLAAIEDDTTTDVLVATIEDVATTVRGARARLDRDAATAATYLADDLSELGRELLIVDDLTTAPSGEVATAASEVVRSAPQFVRGFADDDLLPSYVPALAATCPPPGTATTPWDLVDFSQAAVWLAETPEGAAAGLPLLDVFAEQADVAEAHDRPVSTLDEEYAECAADAHADELGSNAGCDALHDACSAGDDLACDDLYWSSQIGSAYEAFGASCGGRLPIDERTVGDCGHLARPDA